MTNLWFRVDVGMIRHRKIRRLAARLSITRIEAVGLVASVWSYTAEYQADGRLTAEDVEGALDQAGVDVARTPQYTEALVEAGWLEPMDGGWRVHDWEEHQSALSDNKIDDRLRKQAARAQDKVADLMGTQSGPSADSPADNPGTGRRKSAATEHDGTRRTGRTGKAGALARRPTLALIHQELGTIATRAADTTQSLHERRQAGAEFVFYYWATMHRKREGSTILDTKRRSRLVARLSEGDFLQTLDMMLYAVEGSLKDPNLMGQNETGTKYTGVETIFRDRGQVERLADLVTKYKRGIPHRLLSRAQELVNGTDGLSPA